MIAYNIPRHAAKHNKCQFENACWISIHEPLERDGSQTHHISNPILDKLPNIKLKFWDLDAPYQVPCTEQFLAPPSEKDARNIVNFILKNAGKDVVSQCAAGKARSSAISLFCVDFLGYEWDNESKGRAAPNMRLYRLMVDYYQKILDNQNQ